MVKIKIEQEVFTKLPDLKIAFLLLEDVDNKSNLRDSAILIDDTAELVRLLYNKDEILSHQHVAPYNLARIHMKQKLKPMHCALEHHLKSAFNKKSLTTGSTTENVLRHVVLKHLVSASSDDLEKIEGNITFSLSKEKHSLRWLKKLEIGDLVYSDKCLTRPYIGAKLDYAKNPRTNTNKESTRILVHFDILPPIDKTKETEILNNFKSLIKKYTNAKIKTEILSRRKPQCTF